MSENKLPKIDPNYMQRFLHTEQPFPDNYIEDWFLQGMHLNYHVKQLPLKEVIIEALAMLQTISNVILFNWTFFLVSNESLSNQPILLLDILLFALCFISCILLKLSPSIFCGWRSLIIFAVVWGFTPIISSITSGFNPTLIIVITTILFILHIISFDYGYINNYVENVNGIFSYNAVLVASVLLCSILPKFQMVFPLVSLSVLLFEFTPVLRHYLYQKSKNGYFAYTIGLVCVTCIVSFMYSFVAGCVYVLICVIVGYLGPKVWMKSVSMKRFVYFFIIFFYI